MSNGGPSAQRPLTSPGEHWRLGRIMKSQNPPTGIGPQGFRPDFAAAFFKGAFADNEARKPESLS